MRAYVLNIIRLFLVLFFFGNGSNLFAQNFEQLFDYSGEPIAEDLEALQLAADSLVAAFPDEYQNQFKVYDFGFYLHQEDYDGFSYPDEFMDVVRDLESPYYLAFGRQTDGGGINSRVWVEFKFDTEEFLCLDESSITNEALIVMESLNNSEPSSYVAEVKLIEKLTEILINGFCCSSELSVGGSTPNSRYSRSSCVYYSLAQIEEAAECMMANNWPKISEMMKVVKDFFDKCNADDWETFRDSIGVVPHCIWEDKEFEYKYGSADLAFVSGYYDALYEEAKGLVLLVGSADDIHEALKEYYINLFKSLVCKASPALIGDSEGCNLAIDDTEFFKRLCYYWKTNPDAWYSSPYAKPGSHEDFVQTVDGLGIFSASFLGFTVDDCSGPYYLQETLYSIYVAIQEVDTYIEIYTDLLDFASEIWENASEVGNEGRYFKAYYGFRVSLLFTGGGGFSRINWIDNSANYLGQIKNAVSLQKSAYLNHLNKDVGAALMQKTIPKKSWYIALGERQTQFSKDFIHNAKALFWFNTERANAWERLIDAPNGIRLSFNFLDDVASWPASWQIKKGSVSGTIEVFDGSGTPLARIFPDKVVASGRSVLGQPGNKILNRVPPVKNMTYEVDGIDYITDDLGRVLRTSGDLDDMVRVRLGNQQIRAVDVKDGVRGTDQGGHIIGARFFGAGEQINYYPQAANLNLGAWKTMENGWADAMVAGKDVKVDIKAIYNSDSFRPDKIEVEYWIDGEYTFREFDNL